MGNLKVGEFNIAVKIIKLELDGGKIQNQREIVLKQTTNGITNSLDGTLMDLKMVMLNQTIVIIKYLKLTKSFILHENYLSYFKIHNMQVIKIINNI